MALTWAQRFKRVFQIDIEICTQCGGPVKVLASIEDQVVIKKILEHLKNKDDPQDTVQLPDARAPPQGERFDEGKSIYTCRDVVGKAGQGLRSA